MSKPTKKKTPPESHTTNTSSTWGQPFLEPAQMDVLNRQLHQWMANQTQPPYDPMTLLVFELDLIP